MPPSRSAAAWSFSPGRPISPVRAPSSRSACAIAPPSPPLPPPTSARASVSPRSIVVVSGAGEAGVAGRVLGDGEASASAGDGSETEIAIDRLMAPGSNERSRRYCPAGQWSMASRPVSSAIPMTVKWLGHCDSGLTTSSGCSEPSAFIRTMATEAISYPSGVLMPISPRLLPSAIVIVAGQCGPSLAGAAVLPGDATGRTGDADAPGALGGGLVSVSVLPMRIA